LWPTYVLRVGIGRLEQVQFHPQTEEGKRFYAEVSASPVLDSNCQKTREMVMGQSKFMTKKGRARNDQVHKRSGIRDEEEKLRDKVGRLMYSGVPKHIIADVLDVEMEAINWEDVSTPVSDWDVKITQAFLFLVTDPAKVEARIELFSEMPRQKPISLGTNTFSIAQLTCRPDLAENFPRLKFEADTTAVRVHCHLQLWPVVRQISGTDPNQKRAAKLMGQSHDDVNEEPYSITIESAKALRNADTFGKSDPYVKGFLQSGRHKEPDKHPYGFKTKVINDDLDPVWNETKTLFWKGDWKLVLQVFDKDLVGKDDMLGEAILFKDKCNEGLYTDLDLGDGNGHLRVKVVPTRDDKKFSDPPFIQPEPKPVYEAWIYKAENLKVANHFNNLSDPYVLIRTGDKVRCQTNVIWGTLNPEWNYGPHDLELGSFAEVVFEVRDKDMVGSKSIGKASLTRAACKRGFQGYLDLAPKGAGKLFLAVKPKKPEKPAAQQ